MPHDDLAQQLLDAQVRFHLERLDGDQFAATLRELADLLFEAAEKHQIADLVDAAAIKTIVTRAIQQSPGTAGVAGIVDMAVEVASKGPDEPVQLGAVVQREQVEALVDAALALTPVLERALDRLTASPMVGTVASRFMGRVASEVLATNQAIADKIPGLGSITRLGTSAATKVVGAADKQLEGLVGKGGTFAVKRLNRVLLDTISDPATREAVLQVWDLIAAEPLTGLDSHLTEEQISGVSDAGYELVVTTLKHDHARALAESLVDAFLEWFGGYTPTELLDQLDIRRADLVTDLERLAPRVLAAARESGDLERIVRSQLEPFYASSEVADILSADPA